LDERRARDQLDLEALRHGQNCARRGECAGDTPKSQRRYARGDQHGGREEVNKVGFYNFVNERGHARAGTASLAQREHYIKFRNGELQIGHVERLRSRESKTKGFGGSRTIRLKSGWAGLIR